MGLQLPSYILDYKVSTASPTPELLILGRLFTEVGDYARNNTRSADSRALGRLCASRSAKIKEELECRGVRIERYRDWQVPTDLRKLPILRLYEIYCASPERVRMRRVDGREPLTRYIERRIIEQLTSRKPTDNTERLAMDYCLISNRIESAHMTAIFGLPEGDRLPPVPKRMTDSRLAEHIRQQADFKTLAQRDALIELVDIALDRLDRTKLSGHSNSDIQSLAPVAAELLDLRWARKVSCPARVLTILQTAVSHWLRSPRLPEATMHFPLLTLRSELTTI